jgi:hypothetical protein
MCQGCFNQILTLATIEKLKLLSEFNDSKKAAEFIGCAVQTLKQSRVTGQLFGLPAPRFVKLGRSVRYKQSTLQNWCNQFSERRNTGDV